MPKTLLNSKKKTYNLFYFQMFCSMFMSTQDTATFIELEGILSTR